MDPIDLSDSSASDVIDLGDESNDDVIEICEIHNYKNNAQYDDIFKESKLLGEFIEKCLDLENTNGMIRVINRSLIPAYYNTTKIFRESKIFTTVVSKSIRKLDSDPDHKFSYVKELCEEMRIRSKKLDEKLLNKLKYPKTIKRRKKVKWVPRKKRKENEIENVIVSDDSNCFEVPIINLDEYTSQANITEVPLKENCNRMDQEIGFIEVEIDNIAQNISRNEVKVNSNEYFPISNSNLDKQNHININRSQDTLKNDIEDSKYTKNRNEAIINNEKDDLYFNVSANNLTTEESDKNAIAFDTEVSCTEISSTVHVDNNYDGSVKGSHGSDLIVIDKIETELVMTTQEVNDENVSTVPVICKNKCKENIKSFTDKALIVLDEDDTHKQMLTQQGIEEELEENPNINAKKIYSEENFNTVSVSNNNTHITGENYKDSVVNDLIVIDEESEFVTSTQVDLDRTKERSTECTDIVKEQDDNRKSVKIAQNNNLIVIDDEDDLENVACNNNGNNISISSLINEENILLVPHKDEVFKETAEDMVMMNIRRIEFEITALKARIGELEVQEVSHDYNWSPYIQCESYKAKIVKLYKELCVLTGERPVKRREVRLKAANAQSQVCVRKLEDLINKKMGRDGLPHFPDFQDVLQCVREANKEGQLGWDRNEVMREANALFTYCGRALQESRKRREWRDLLSLVKSEVIEDPADKDPDLMMRLQANRLLAVKKEKDLLDRYCEMSYHSNTECTTEKYAHDSDSENETGNDDEEMTSTQDTARDTSSQHIHKTSVNNQCTDSKFKAMEAFSQHLIKEVLSPSANGLTETHHTVEKDIPKILTLGSHVKKRCTPIRLDDKPSRSALVNSKTPDSRIDPKNILNHNFNLIAKVVLHKIELPKTENPESYDVNKENNMSESENTHLVNEVKKEPLVDIQEELDQLGNDFTATVIDIEDPFLVVEISSDSEDEDDDLTRNEVLL